MNENKISFIICTNNNIWMDECEKYINRLYVPEGYEVDIQKIEGASSMASGYNRGMNQSDAKYKVYMHHDVFIVNRYFLYCLLQIFKSDTSIGMFGVVGTKKMSVDGVMWNAKRVGGIGGWLSTDTDYEKYVYSIKDGLFDVVALDGCLIATQYDLPWREDLFKEWDFYDVSQGFEFRKNGYRVVVPNQEYAWIVHDSKYMSLKYYDENRQKFLNEYSSLVEFFE